MKNEKLATAASAGLSLYAFYKIIQTLTIAFDRSYSPFTPFGQRLFSFLSNSIYYWVLLALGLCGLVLVYADLNKNKDMDFQNRINKIKKIIFTTYTIFSIIMIFRFVYWTYLSFQSYYSAIAAGNDMQGFSVRFFINLVIIGVFGAFSILSRTLFGIYLLTKKERLLKPFLIMYIAGFAYTLISETYVFINAIIFNINLFADASKIANLGNPENRINSIIFNFAGDILVLVTGLIIILYGIKKDKLPASDEKQPEVRSNYGK